MSRAQSTQRRFENALRKLDDRVENQAMQAGADAPAAVRLVDRFHSWAGALEKTFRLRDALTRKVAGQGLRQLHRLQVEHARAVRR